MHGTQQPEGDAEGADIRLGSGERQQNILSIASHSGIQKDGQAGGGDGTAEALHDVDGRSRNRDGLLRD